MARGEETPAPSRAGGRARARESLGRRRETVRKRRAGGEKVSARRAPILRAARGRSSETGRDPRNPRPLIAARSAGSASNARRLGTSDPSGLGKDVHLLRRRQLPRLPLPRQQWLHARAYTFGYEIVHREDVHSAGHGASPRRPHLVHPEGAAVPRARGESERGAPPAGSSATRERASGAASGPGPPSETRSAGAPARFSRARRSAASIAAARRARATRRRTRRLTSAAPRRRARARVRVSPPSPRSRPTSPRPPSAPPHRRNGTDVDSNFSMLTSRDLLSKPVEDLKTIVKEKRNMTDAEREAARAEELAREQRQRAADGDGSPDGATRRMWIPPPRTTAAAATASRSSPRTTSRSSRGTPPRCSSARGRPRPRSSRAAAATRRRGCGRCPRAPRPRGQGAAPPAAVLDHEKKDGAGGRGEGRGRARADEAKKDDAKASAKSAEAR